MSSPVRSFRDRGGPELRNQVLASEHADPGHGQSRGLAGQLGPKRTVADNAQVVSGPFSGVSRTQQPERFGQNRYTLLLNKPADKEDPTGAALLLRGQQPDGGHVDSHRKHHRGGRVGAKGYHPSYMSVFMVATASAFLRTALSRRRLTRSRSP